MIRNYVLNIGGYDDETKASETGESLLTVTTDDYETSYYYCGNVEDNYVEFNNMC